MRPPQSHAPVPNQQQPAFLPPQGQVPSIPSAQQQPIHPHAQQPGHSVHQRPVMQPIQSVPQQYVQQQPFPLQTSGTVQNQLHQQGHFVQQQLPMQSQSRPPGPPHSVQQNSHAYLQPQQNVAHGMQPHQSQNYVGRPMMPNHGAQSHSFPQSPGGFSGAAQVRPMQLGANQPSTIQNYLPRTNSQLQTSSEQLVQAGLTSNPTVFERQDGKSMDTEQNPVGGDDDNPSQVGTLAKDADSESHATENGSGEPAIKPMGKKECTESGLPSPGGKSIEIVVGEQKDAANVPKVDHSSVDDTSLQQTKSLDEQSGKMPKVAMDAGRLVSTGTDKGSQAVPPDSAPIPDSFAQNVALQGNAQTPLTGRDPLQHGYQERNLSQSQLTPQGPGVDEFRGFPPHGQVPGKGFGHPAPIPLTDQGRHHQPPMQYGPSTQQHRPAAPSMLQSVPPPGPPHHAQVPGQPPTLLRPQGPGNLPQAGQPLNPPEHFQPPAKQPYGSFHPELSLGGIPGPGSSSSFGRGPSHFGPPQRSFELQSSAPQGHYNQGHVPPPHAGLPRISQGEPPVGGVPQGPLPPGSSVLHGGIMGRAPPHGPEGQFGQQRPINPMETEIFPNQRSRHFDGRQHDSHLPGTLERGPFGQPPGIESNAMRMNGAPGLDSTSTLGFRDERFRPLTEEHLNPFPLDPAQRHDQDATSRPLDKPPLGLSYDAGMKLDPVAGGAPSRFLPPYHGILHPNDTGERAHLVGPDDIGRADISRTRTDFPGPIAGFGRHHMDHRSPGRENPGVPTRGFGGLSGGPRNQSGLDDIDGRESRPFSEGSRSVNLPSDPVGNSFFESRFPVLPSHLRRGELDGPGNFRGGDLIGQDSLPSHFRRGELLGPRNLPGHLRMGEPTGFGAFPGHGRMGELAGPGNFPHHLPLGESFGSKSSHPQLGEPGFRSSYSLQGFPNDGGFYKGGMDSFGNSRKRKPVSMGWCRICKVDCETVEGLDLHSQTREHQNKTMDMVRSIKQQNAKKQKTSNVHASLEEAGNRVFSIFAFGDIGCCPVIGDGFFFGTEVSVAIFSIQPVFFRRSRRLKG
ncbi:hypothetical protein F0562_001033 [Nyssa sinensis]|uniref:U1-type domain-containing protein n=1 Tax=Nyssa sinensis TaxID=561372 RepID=A0A5J5C2E0_9ASTE|nr:hypothetical protein F0562_001033 [Nyssa sinensis]